MRTGVMVVLAVLTGLAGGWMVAKYQLTDRVSQVAVDARNLCKAPRGKAPMTLELLEERFASIAEEHLLEASAIRIDIKPVTAGAEGAAAQIAGSLSKLTKGKLKMEANEVIVSARLQGKKWIWSVDRDIEANCILRGRVTRTGL